MNLVIHTATNPMTVLQHHRPPAHPLLHRASNLIWKATIPIVVVTFAVFIPVVLGWIGDPGWMLPTTRVLLVSFALADALNSLSTVRRDSRTRWMQRVSAVLLPVALTFLEADDFPTRVALATVMLFGVAYTLDTQSDVTAWSRDRWLAGAGSLGFPLFLAGAIIPSYPLLLASGPPLMIALGSALRLYMDQPRE